MFDVDPPGLPTPWPTETWDGQHGLRGRRRFDRSCGDAWAGSCRGRSSLSRPRDCKCDGDRKEEEEDYVDPHVLTESILVQET